MVTLVFVAVLLGAFGLDRWLMRRLEAKLAHRPAEHGGDAVELTVPRTLFFHPSHTWARLDDDGSVTVGIDELVRTLVDELASVELPVVGDRVRAGSAAITIRSGPGSLTLASPIGGTVLAVNRDLGSDPVRLRWRPYKESWALRLSPGGDLASELASLVVGRDAERWMAAETRRVDALFERGLLSPPIAGALRRAGSESWSAFAREIVGRAPSEEAPT